MFEESITIDIPFEETRKIAKDLITKRFGTIVNEGSRHISWKIGTEPKIIRCNTYLEQEKDFTKVITEYTTDEFWKNEAKQTIHKFYTSLIQNQETETLNKKEKTKPKKKKGTNWNLVGLIITGSVVGSVMLGGMISDISDIFPERKKTEVEQIENYVDFELHKYHIIPNVKFSANIRLEREISERELKNLALSIYKKYNLSSYERSFLVYYLPGMKFGAGGWATTHFNPDLEVRIFGSF